MSRPSTEEIRDWVGLTVLDSDGQEIGRCTRAYADDETGDSEWLAVELESGQDSHLVPVSDARRDGDDVRVAFARTLISTSPPLGAPTFVSLEEETRLYSHYEVPTPQQEESTDAPGTGRHRMVRLLGVADESGSAGASYAGTGTTTDGDLSVSSTSEPSQSAPYAATSDVPAEDSASASAGAAARTEQLGAGGTSAPAAATFATPEPAWQSSAWEDSGSSPARRAATVAVPAGALAAATVAGVRARRTRQRQKALAAQRKSFGSVAALIPPAAVLAVVVRKVRGRTSEPAPVTIDQTKAPVVSTTATAALPDPAAMPSAGAPVADLPAGSSDSGRRRRLRVRRNGQHLS